ncbi:hypothetical protein BaRGS_00001200, partial [Batillaria attramentaria]
DSAPTLQDPPYVSEKNQSAKIVCGAPPGGTDQWDSHMARVRSPLADAWQRTETVNSGAVPRVRAETDAQRNPDRIYMSPIAEVKQTSTASSPGCVKRKVQKGEEAEEVALSLATQMERARDGSFEPVTTVSLIRSSGLLAVSPLLLLYTQECSDVTRDIYSHL